MGIVGRLFLIFHYNLFHYNSLYNLWAGPEREIYPSRTRYAVTKASLGYNSKNMSSIQCVITLKQIKKTEKYIGGIQMFLKSSSGTRQRNVHSIK